MIVTFDDRKNMYSETLRVFKDYSAIPPCSHCGGKLDYNKSINYISCNSTLPNGQKCYDRHGNDYKEVFEFDEEEFNELKTFSSYCQTLKPFVKRHSHFKLHATLPIKCAKSIKYRRGLNAKVDSLVTFCEKYHDGYPHLSKEVKLKLEHPELSDNEIKEKMFELTDDEFYLSDEAKDMFIF